MKFSDLTPSSTVADALYAYIASPFIQSRGSSRAAEPYYALARSATHAKISQLQLSEVNRRAVSAWRDSLTEEHGYSSGTVDGLLSKLRRLGHRLVDYDLLKSNYFAEVGNARPTDKKRLTRALSREECAEITAALTSVSPDYGRAWEFVLQTSLRCSEVADARFEHYDPVGRRLWIPVSRDKARKGRFVPLTPYAESLITGTRPGDPLITSASQNTLRGAMARCAARAGRSWFWHLGRHTSISRAMCHLSTVRALMDFSGHSTVVGLQGYLHKDRDFKSKTVLQELPATL